MTSAEVERQEDEGAKAFDPHLTRRLLGYLRPYRLRATGAVLLVILSSLMEIAGPASACGEGLIVSNNESNADLHPHEEMPCTK